jgi:flagellar motor switch protein FliM
MSQYLSQDEIDALLNAVNDDAPPATDGSSALASAPAANTAPGNVANPAGAEAAPKAAVQNPANNERIFGRALQLEAINQNIQPYDITNQDRIIRGRMPMMDLINDRFTRSFRVSLSSVLRKTTSVNVINREMSKFGELLTTLPIPTCICVIRLNELRGPALIIIESKLSYAIIDSFFGGRDRPFTKVDGKEFTKIELTFMKRIMDIAIRDLEEAWAPIQNLDAQFMRAEINPQFASIVPPSEVVLNTTYEIEFESASGTVMVVFPYSTIEPVKQKLSSTFQTDTDVVDTVWSSYLTKHIQTVELIARVKLGEADIKLSEIVNLNVGDVIPLTQDVSGELCVEVEDVAKLKCLSGIYKGSRAVQITKKMDI